jgi:hypothetical protein
LYQTLKCANVQISVKIDFFLQQLCLIRYHQKRERDEIQRDYFLTLRYILDQRCRVRGLCNSRKSKRKVEKITTRSTYDISLDVNNCMTDAIKNSLRTREKKRIFFKDDYKIDIFRTWLTANI